MSIITKEELATIEKTWNYNPDAQFPKFISKLITTARAYHAQEEEIERLKTWSYCPECGSENHEHFHGYAETHRSCQDCGQDWHTDINYLNSAVKENLSTTEKLRANVRELVGALEKIHAIAEGNFYANEFPDKMSDVSDIARAIITRATGTTNQDEE